MRQTLVPAALLIVVVAVLYAPTLRYPFIYEDQNDPDTFLAETTGRELAARLAAAPMRAVTELTLAANRAVFGASNPVGYHAGNVALHLLNVVLVLLIAWQWVPPAASVLVALAFAVHPLNVEAVAYVSARSELVASSGVLLALLGASLGAFTVALVGVLLACLGKETAVMAWGLVPLWAIVTRTAFPVRRWSLTAGAVGMAGALALNWSHVPLGVDVGVVGRTAAAVCRLVALIPFPVGLTMDHDWHGVPFWLQMAALAALIVLAGVSAAVVRDRCHWMALAALATVLWFLPRFVVPVPEGLHEHHMVVPLAVWLICAGAWLSRSFFRVEYPSHG